MKKRVLDLFVVYFAIVSLLLQTISPIFNLTSIANAQETNQEVTSEESTPVVENTTPESTSTQVTEDLTKTPDANTQAPDASVPTETVTPVPTVTETEITPATDQPETTTTPVPNENSPPEEINISDAPTSATLTPETDTQDPTGNEDINMVILENVSAPSIDLGVIEPQNSANLTTDKGDYAPTDTALITGTGLNTNTDYNLRIWSDNAPATSSEMKITSDGDGTFVYAYQLDGTYRPNYSAELKDSEGTVVASVTFTDSPICNSDAQGVDDQPGQKDLTRMCADYAAIPTSVDIKWNWDEINGSGGNTFDACSLYDTDNDGFANYSACVTVTGSPLIQASNSPRIYSCNDTKSDRCAGDSLITGPYITTCSTSQTSTDPFPTGDVSPQDTTATCTVSLSEVGGTSSKLIDVCSFPSQQPNSDPSDCIIASTANQNGLLEVKKVLSPSNDTGLFNLQINSNTFATDATHNGTTGEKVVTAGNNTIGEVAGTGTSLSNYTASAVCKDNNGTGSIVSTSGTNPWTVNVTNNADVVCTITNTRINNGSITIVKDAIPNDAQDFAFTTTGTGLSNFSLDDDGETTILSNTKVFSSLGAETYSVTEGAVAGWTQTSATCDDGSPVSAIALQAGEKVTCTFTNTKNPGSIELKKIWSGTGGQTTLNIGTSAGGSDVDFQQTGAAGVDPLTTDVNTVNAGTYYVSETGGLDNYTSGLVCTKNEQSYIPGASNAVVVDSDDVVVCTFTNTRNTGSVQVNKLLDNNGDGSFETSNPASFNWSLDGSGTNTMGSIVNNVNTGNHSINENSVENYHLVGWYTTGNTAGYSCTNPEGTSLPAGINVTKDNTSSITICNARDTGTVVVHKDVQGPNGEVLTDTTTDFTIDLDGSNSQNITDEEVYTYTNVPTGSHTVHETNVSSDYTLHGISLITGESGNTGGLTFDVNKDKTTHVYVTNRQKLATIIVQKVVKNAAGNDTDDNHAFTVQLNGGNSVNTLAENNNVTYNNINPGGLYTVSETTDPDYDNLGCKLPTGALATDFNLTSNQSITVTCTNQQKPGSISGYKFQSNGITPIANWGISLFSCDSGFTTCSANAILTTLTNASGFYSFTNLIVGFYKVVEDLVNTYTPVGVTFHNVTINPATESTNNNFSNFENVDVTACKKVDADGSLNTTNDQTNKSGWTVNLLTDGQVTNTELTGDNGCYTWTNLEPGYTYGVSENLPTGWQNLTPLTYDFGNPEDGIDESYTFVNVQLGSIIVKKVMVGGTGSFDFTGDVSGTISTNNGTLSTINKLPGTYTSTEGIEEGWTLSSINCDDTTNGGIASTGDTGTRTATFKLDAGETVTCTFTNTRKIGRLYIDKILSTGPATQSSWNFTVKNLAGQTLGTLIDNGINNYIDLPTGQYTVTESSNIPGYTLSSVGGVCTNRNGYTATATVGEGNNTCSFTNFRDVGFVRVHKQVDLNGDGDFNDTDEKSDTIANSLGFRWKLDGGYIDYQMGMASPATYTTVPGVSHYVTENSVTGYHYIGYSNTGNCNSLSGTSSQIPVTINKNTTSEVTICNAHDTGTVRVNKTLVPSNDGGKFNLKINDTTYASNIGNNGTTGAKTIKTGTVTVSETSGTNTSLSNYLTTYSCTNGVTGNSTSATFTLSKNQNVTCTFTNTKLGTIIIGKDTNPETNSDVRFNYSGDLGSGNFFNNDTDTFNNLLPKSYTITEDEKSGWYLDSISCSPGSSVSKNIANRSVTINLRPGENVTCTFNNYKLGKIIGEKFNDKNGNNQDDSGEPDLAGWTIFIDENDNEILDSEEISTVTNGGGDYSFENLKPGNYKICEVQKTGWFSSKPNKAICESTTIHSDGGDTDTINFGNHESVVIKTSKVVCDNESDLPNWGSGIAPNITASTAQDYVNNHPSCRLESGWDFQYGFGSKPGNPGVSTYGDGATTGLAPIGIGYNDWKMIGTTDVSPAEVLISDLENANKVWVRENLKPDYVPFSYPPGSKPGNDYSAEIYCHNDGLNYDNYDFVNNPKYGDTYHCVAFNALNKGGLEVTKYFDRNQNGVKDGDETVLSGWEITLTDQESQITDNAGKVKFEDLTVGTYYLDEVLQDGWEQTAITCSTDENEQIDRLDRVQVLEDITDLPTGHELQVNQNQTTYCEIGNYTSPLITISKLNNANSTKRIGDLVEYTIVVKLDEEGGPAQNVEVTDLPPDGFTYQGGSWQASINGAPISIPEPTYASPGQWQIGDMNPGDEVVLKYLAKIQNEVTNGTYFDVALAIGNPIRDTDTKIFAIATDPGDTDPGVSDSNFVGTKVVVTSDTTESVSFESTSTQEVLGASTELPATGIPYIYVNIAILVFGIGVVTLLMGVLIRRKYE